MIKYGLKTIKADKTSYNGFLWSLGKVEAPDWNEKKECGHGLHFALNGEGDGNLFNWSDDALWVVAKLHGKIIDLEGKVKVKSCTVIYIGDRKTATDIIVEKTNSACIGCYKTGGDRSTLTGGDWSTLTGGDRSTLTGRKESTLTGGDRSTLTGGAWSTLTGGDGSILIWKYYDGKRIRIKTEYVGKNDIKPDTKYKGRFIDNRFVI